MTGALVMSAESRRSRPPFAPLVMALAAAACHRDAAAPGRDAGTSAAEVKEPEVGLAHHRDAARPGRDAGTSAAEAKVPDVELAHQTWSEGLLADTYVENVSAMAGEPLPVRLPPLLRADAAGTMWLLDGRGTLIRRGP